MVRVWVFFILFFILFVFPRFPTVNISYNYNTRRSKHYYFLKMIGDAAPHFFFFAKQQLLRTINFLPHPSK